MKLLPFLSRGSCLAPGRRAFSEILSESHRVLSPPTDTDRTDKTPLYAPSGPVCRLGWSVVSEPSGFVRLQRPPAGHSWACQSGYPWERLPTTRPQSMWPTHCCRAYDLKGLVETGGFESMPRSAVRYSSLRKQLSGSRAYCGYDAKRGNTTQRGYGGRWQRFHKWYLAKHPLCKHCGEVATEVDHIVPLAHGGAHYSVSNSQALCRRCHRKKTVKDGKKYANAISG